MDKNIFLPAVGQEANTTPNELKREENKQLIDSIMARGEMRLVHGDISGIELFETAAALSPADGALFFRQALALYEFGSHEGREKHLFLANKKFKKAIELSPHNPSIWHAWGNNLYTLGAAYNQERHYQAAREKYERAQKLGGASSDLFWDLGCAWLALGDFSLEAVDTIHALNAFQKSCEEGAARPAEFWLDYARAHTALANHVNDSRHLIKAINCYRYALHLNEENSTTWGALASTCKTLYSITHDDDHFSQATDCFATAAKLDPHNGKLFIEWAQLLFFSGKQLCDLKRLHASIEKCRLASTCLVDLYLITPVWAQTLAAIGYLTDRLDLIFEAENKINDAIEYNPDNPALYHAHGSTLHILGNYFNDVDYYYQAIEKFQEGLSIDRTRHTLWHSMALSYSAISEIESDPGVFEKVRRFFNKALHIQTSSQYLFDFALALSKYGEITSNQNCLEEAICYFEQALALQKNAPYLHPDWLYHYAITLDLLGEYHDTDTYYLRAIEILNHVLMMDPDYPHIHHRLALSFNHFGELASEPDLFHKALHHFRLAHKRDDENDVIFLDWGLCQINLAEHMYDREAAGVIYAEAEMKITKAAQLGNASAYYHLGGLQALLGQGERAMSFLQKADCFDALPPLEEILDDEWLDNIKHLSSFRIFISQIESRAHSEQ